MGLDYILCFHLTACKTAKNFPQSLNQRLYKYDLWSSHAVQCITLEKIKTIYLLLCKSIIALELNFKISFFVCYFTDLSVKDKNWFIWKFDVN